MDFEWDEAKSDACFVERGFDFPYVAQVFLDVQRVVRPDVRIYQVAYTMRGRVIRIISARKANLREVILYENGAF
jgi:uncharacterized protein